uniref:Uncharacterized protein n=1 Tax=Arundo donax TaxID=35708 RepID=A0A0A8ZKZ8_ARUDO
MGPCGLQESNPRK